MKQISQDCPGQIVRVFVASGLAHRCALPLPRLRKAGSGELACP